MLAKITELMARCGSADTVMPPTELYNEGWMLRLVLDWFERHREPGSPLQFQPGARWYSEALLPSRFMAQYRGDHRAESFTHADGLIGHFDIRPGERGAAALRGDATQFVVCEGKLGSVLSLGTTNAANFDQAARNVACMAHMIGEAQVPLEQIRRLGFCVIAPRRQIEARAFRDLVTKESVRTKVATRIGQYDGDLDEWFRAVFEPVLEKIELQLLAWETILENLPGGDEAEGLREFYAQCLRFNPMRLPNMRGSAGSAVADPRPMCRECARAAFKQWRGWCAYGLHDPPPVPDVPRLEDGRCPRCQGTVGVEPGQVRYVNAHGEGSTGLPDYFVLEICESGGSAAESRWGMPYLDATVGRVPVTDLPRQYPAHGWRERSWSF